MSYLNEVIKALKSVKNLIVLDTETTGFNAENDRIVEFSAVKYAIHEDFSLFERDSLDRFIHSDIPVPEAVVAITGISNEFLEDKPSEAEIFPKIAAFLDGAELIVGYSTAFDLRFIQAMYARQGAVMPDIESIDALKLAKELLNKTMVPNHKLCTVADFFGVAEKFKFHSSLNDVWATATVLQKMLQMQREKTAGNTVKSISYWAGAGGRIYVNTKDGDLFFDLARNEWRSTAKRIDQFDLEEIQKQCLNLTHSADAIQFKNFRSTIIV